MKSILLVLPLLLLLAFAIHAAKLGWGIGGDVEIGAHGYAALAIGAVATVAITALLVGLMLYSRRHGHDDDGSPGSDT